MSKDPDVQVNFLGHAGTERSFHMSHPCILNRCALFVLLHLLGISDLREQLSQSQHVRNRPAGGRAILAAHLRGRTEVKNTGTLLAERYRPVRMVS